MKKLAGILFCFAVLHAAPVMAQGAAPGPQNLPNAPVPASTSASKPAITEEYNPRIPAEFEISGGYVYRKYSPTPSTSFGMNGGYVSVDYNVFSWLGAVAEGLAVGRISGTQSLGTYQKWGIAAGLGGAQFYPLRHRKVTPFGHALVGEGYYVLSSPAFADFPSKTTTSTGMIYEVGGGFDLRIKRHWSIRLAEADYGSTAFLGGTPRQLSYRVSAGVVFLHGQK
jgi:hypothetical protein